jgi:hypothetical protein
VLTQNFINYSFFYYIYKYMGLGGILGFSEAGIDAMLLGEGLALAPETFGASIALAGLMVGVAKLK